MAKPPMTLVPPLPPPGGACHLAWYLPHIAGVVGGGARVRYLAVPVVLEKFTKGTRMTLVRAGGA
ncbi:MAG TPA: hypothetical protein DD490_06945 [Acidobacteria bacterium]|nr:hypothetical protein [Acidobacteriota bacterium]